MKPAFVKPSRKTLLLIFLAFVPFTFLHISHVRIHHSLSTLLEKQLHEQTPKNQTWREVRYKPIFYLKTHKTGSSTIAVALARYARRHRLRIYTGNHSIYHTWNNPLGTTFDAVVLHHFSYDRDVIRSYLGADPELVVTSIRLPVQRQLSWFRQQNTQFENITECDSPHQELLDYYDNWYPKRSQPQYLTLMERHSRDRLEEDAVAVVDQFDFVFISERMRESYECFCKMKGISLCDKGVENLNVKPANSCVERQLLRYRREKLGAGSEKDLLVYEVVQNRLSQCIRDIPPECRCEG